MTGFRGNLNREELRHMHDASIRDTSFYYVFPVLVARCSQIGRQAHSLVADIQQYQTENIWQQKVHLYFYILH